MEEEARIAKLSASSLANTAIETFLAARAAKRSQIESARVDAEKGEFISGEALDRWIDSREGKRSFSLQSLTYSVETHSR